MNPRDQLRQHFQEEYARLNEQQKRAVDQIEGPVMVVAGPGTGKTQILAARIGKILLDTDAGPGNILCLTYTEAGALAMRRRLLHFIGSDAYRVHIHTFHAFCNEIIQENLSVFEKNALDPVSDIERLEIMRDLIHELPVDSPLKRFRGDVYFDISELSGLFSTIKREGWRTADLISGIDAYIADLPNREEFIYKRPYKGAKKGDPKTEAIAKETQKMERLKAAVLAFDRFQELMAARNRYDFDDMINWVIEAFEKDPILLQQYQERFLYVLVDEFQDTSGSQNRLVRLLINYWDRPNIFVVGDDDQSIFRFQGANVENMEQFHQSFAADLLRVVLVQNYRSIQSILDVSGALIARNNERLINSMDGLSKDLVASHPAMTGRNETPQILQFASPRDEMAGITLRVEALLKAGVEPCEIAVIYRENKYGEELMQFFRHRKIPYYSKRSLNLLDLPLAGKIIQILEYLAAETENPYSGADLLFRIMHFDFFGVPPIEMARLSTEVAERAYGDQPVTLRDLIHQRSTQPPRELFDQRLHPAVQDAGRCLERLIGAVMNETLQSLLERVLRETGLLGRIMQDEERHWHLQVITVLFDFVREETRRNPDLTLPQLVAIIRLMRQQKLSIPIVQVGGTDQGVHLLTAHGSKGLEFGHVFLAGCTAKVWENRSVRGTQFRIPDTIIRSSVEGSQLEELRRLFYVALTRAKTALTISYPVCDPSGRETEPTQFIAEIRDTHTLPVETVSLSADELSDFRSVYFLQTAAPRLADMEEEVIGRTLQRFMLSVTALNDYLRCPLRFYYQHLIRIPSPKNEAMTFGSAVHFALQKLYEKMKADPQERFPGPESLVEDFSWFLHRHRESFTREAFARRLEYGRQILPRYYEERLPRWNRIAVVERNIRNVVLRGVPLKGKIDKLEFRGHAVDLIDYKTGKVDTRGKLSGPSEKVPLGGDYWRQAVFYKILVEQSHREWRVEHVLFDYVEPQESGNFPVLTVRVTEADTEAVTAQITEVWDKIQRHDFYTGCGRPDCDYCTFVKTNTLFASLHDPGEELETEAPLPGGSLNSGDFNPP